MFLFPANSDTTPYNKQPQHNVMAGGPLQNVMKIAPSGGKSKRKTQNSVT